MHSLGNVSDRIQRIYTNYYGDREKIRFTNLFTVFKNITDPVQPRGGEFEIRLDSLKMAELIRSYFLDTIRYKEYHMSPKEDDPICQNALQKLNISSISELSPMGEKWTELLHKTARINENKVASLSAKWITQYKPITVIDNRQAGSALFYPEYVKSINEYFALNVAFWALNIRADLVNPDKIDELIYNLRFRAYDEGKYFMIFSKEYLLK